MSSAASQSRFRHARLLAQAGLVLCLGIAGVVAAPIRAADDEAKKQTAADEAKIRKAFEVYKSAVLEQKGERAASVLSSGTLDYYGRLQHHALFSSAEKVRVLPLMERMQVLFYRMHIPGQDLVRMSSEDVVAYAIDRGWVGKQEMADSELGEIEVDQEEALAEHRIRGQSTGIKYHFVRDAHNGHWRFDLLPILLASNEVMQVAATRANMAEDELMTELLQSTGGSKTPLDELWAPLFPDTPAK